VTNPHATVPDRDAFANRFAPAAPRASAVRELYALATAADPSDSIEARAQWLVRVARWLGKGALPRLDDGAPIEESPRSARLRFLLRVWDEVPAWRGAAIGVVGTLLRDTSAFRLLSRVGLPGDRSFLAEASDRLSRRVLPSPRDERDLSEVVERLFPGPADAAWLGALDAALATRVAALLDGGATWRPLAHAAADAALLLATRVAALGLSDDIRARSPAIPLRESPLFRLPRACDALLALCESASPAPEAEIERAWHEVRSLLADSRATVTRVIESLETSGVSVDVVYRLEVMTKSMDRLGALLESLLPAPPSERVRRAVRLCAGLVEDRVRDRSLGNLARTSLHLLARKIIERAGQTGEHYITTTRAEYRAMLVSAAGGGVLTAGTAALKFALGSLHTAPFVEGVLAWANYAGSFLLMQALGLTLATKQPSMTAAALAHTLRETAGHAELDDLVTLIARITRSQIAAAVGNIGLVVPSAIALDAAVRATTGAPLLDAEKAAYVIESLHPFASGALWYAALTGALLWASSIAAGWVENWAVYRRLPEAIAHHRIGRLIGRRATEWASRVFVRNVSGVGGNVTLGFLLGMTPIFGKFLGLPLDVRHVTLSAGSLVFAVLALGAAAPTGGILAAALGVLAIGALNFGVSFVLALLVALRAREVDRSDRLRLMRTVVTRFFASPRQFLFPPPTHGRATVVPPAGVDG
jgi:site-specific recombinase